MARTSEQPLLAEGDCRQAFSARVGWKSNAEAAVSNRDRRRRDSLQERSWLRARKGRRRNFKSRNADCYDGNLARFKQKMRLRLGRIIPKGIANGTGLARGKEQLTFYGVQ